MVELNTSNMQPSLSQAANIATKLATDAEQAASFPLEVVHMLALQLTPDPKDFRYNDGVIEIVNGCRSIINVSEVCVDWHVSVETPTLKEEPRGFGEVKKGERVFVLTARGKRMKFYARVFDWKNPYKRDGTKKRIFDALLPGILKRLNRHDMGANLHVMKFYLPLDTLDALVEDEYRQRRRTRRYVLRAAQSMVEVAPFLTLQKLRRSWVWKVRSVQTDLIYITSSKISQPAIEFWQRAAEQVRNYIYMIDFNASKSDVRETFKNEMMRRLTPLVIGSPYNCAEILGTEIIECAWMLYQDGRITTNKGMLLGMDELWTRKGIWLGWLSSTWQFLSYRVD